MWIETRGQQHRVYWRTGLPSPQKAYEPFPSRDQAELFKELARRSGTLQGALAYVRDPQPQVLRQLLGMAPLPEAARPAPPCPAPASPVAPGVPTVGLTFAELWARFLKEQRQLEETTAELYAGYGKFHSQPWPWPLEPGCGAPLERFGLADEVCRRVGARLLRELRSPAQATGGRAHQGGERRVLQRFENWSRPAGHPDARYEDEPTQFGAEARQNNSGRENFIVLFRRESVGAQKGRTGWNWLGAGEPPFLPAYLEPVTGRPGTDGSLRLAAQTAAMPAVVPLLL